MRSALRPVIVAALVTSLTALPTAAESSPDRAASEARVTLTAESDDVAIGNKVKLTGTAPVSRGARVTIWQMQIATGHWNVEGSTRTRRGGAFRYSEVVHDGDRVYRACVRWNGRTLCSKGLRIDLVKERRYLITAKPAATGYQAGQTVEIGGTVKPGAKGDVVKLVRAAWATDEPGQVVAKSRIRKGGTFSLATPGEAGDWAYWVTKPKTAIGRKSNSPVARVKVAKAAVSLAVGWVLPTTMDAGQPVTVTGTASANLVGQTVYLQTYDAGTSAWGSVGSAVVDAAAGWTISAAMNRAEKAVQLRVYAPESAATAAGSVAAGAVTVYGWYYLAELSMVDSVRFDTGSASVAGVTYSRSAYNDVDFWWNNTPWGEWNLGYSCKTFQAAIGMDDASESGFQVGFRSFADSVERYHGVMTTGQQPMAASFDLTSVFRLKLQDEYVSGTKGSGGGHGWGVWADARVLCAF